MKRAFVIVLVLGQSLLMAWAQAPQGPAARGGQRGAAADGGRGGGGAPRGGGLPARILSFEANPTTIKPGGSFVLSWSTENGTFSIDNGIGVTSPRGQVRLTPKATTTYTLSAGGGGDVRRSVTVTVEGTTAVSGNQGAVTREIQRIDGKPNLTGVYASSFGSGATAGRGGAAAQPPASPFANLPAQPTMKPGVSNRGAGGNPSGGYADCLPLPVDTAFAVPYPWQIIQSKDYVVFFHEYPGTFRIIPLDGQPHPVDPDPTWLGDSIGHWDGDTLVIDTVGFNGKKAIGTIQQPSEKFHTIERLTKISPTSVFYEIIYEDPEFATGQWRSTRTLNLDVRPGVNKIMEFVCENNRDYTPLFGPEGPPAGGGRGGRGE